jgi:hypothetical protein
MILAAGDRAFPGTMTGATINVMPKTIIPMQKRRPAAPPRIV